MAIAGFGKSQLRYDMFDLTRSAAEARRLAKCEHIYHRGQTLAWDGKDVLGELLAKHGGVRVPEAQRRALERVFTIILWGELAAWKISAQLADRLVPLEAKLAATSQAHDEARHFYVMHDYLAALGHTPGRLDRAPQALLDLVLETDDLAAKLMGMQLMIETIALALFQAVREREVEPVLTELMRYYERDEARHVGLGMQYLPSLLAGMTRRQGMRLVTYQVRILYWGLTELRLVKDDFETLGIDPRAIIESVRKKQLAALGAAYEAVGIPFDRDRNWAAASLNAAVELLFPPTPAAVTARARAAWDAFWRRNQPGSLDVFAPHQHAIRTARGQVASAGE
ncbi:MAG: ferritin-like domain-containing protein [Kofleriaceae bacterium]|nr:ferritin-like domain-containing protein [Kofleriaceae bacterium]MCL4223424.1 ferritin-like domain-containing protein [Myxococcales bacterium]